MSAVHRHGKSSSTEPAILYAILALGAVHEQELAITEPCNVRDDEANNPQSPNTAGHLGLQYYNKSISLLQPHLLKSGTGSTRVALIVCTIYVCLEFMQKRYRPGFLHFGYSLQLLGNLLRNRSSATSTDPSDDWFAEVIPRLDLQAALLMNEFYLGAADATSFIWHPLPQAFQTTRDASHSLDGLLFRAHQLQKNGSAIKLSEDAVNIFELLATQQALRKDLEEWLHYFEVFKENSLSHLSNGERLICQRLPIYHTMAHIIINTSLNPRDELIFDLYTHQFASVVSHSRQIINTIQPSELPTPAADTPGSHVPQLDCPADIGLIPPLFYTAIKCRVPRIRRQAVELILLGQRHEGIWDADLTARVAREVMTLEERGVQESPQDGKCDSPDSSSSISSIPSIPSPPRVNRLWIEAPGDLKGDIQLSVQRIKNGETQETLTRRYHPVNGTWTSYPVPPRVSGAIKHESGK
ncbi:C6 zinc finger domain-containing protein [Colletotrichum zoysiae]|uniref:C6 zinc finger domain-containing protein n=1 Tax=Colletotrichum zoysiae TaxID=1216348 RepID=A0AAD9HGG0_9PEZI|nr:C6 zinc finger domain-containing protein [Colletotrichum zoysiae]